MEVLQEMITFQYSDNYFVFTTDGLEINDWASKAHSGLNYLIGLLSEDLAEVQTINSVKVHESHIARLPSSILGALNLPEVSPYTLKIQTSGSILRNNFDIAYQLLSENGPAIGVEVEGCFLRKGTKKFIISEPYYSSITLINKFQSVNDLSTKLSLLKELKSILPPEVFTDDERLKSFNLIRASKVTIDVKDDSEFLLAPEFVLPSDPDSSLLAPSANESIKTQFNKLSACSNIYQISHNTFLILDPIVFEICKEIKSANHKTRAERLSFYYTPQRYLKESLKGISSEQLDDVFAESQFFISKRITHIGIWEPKIHAFIPKSGNNWIPKDLITIQAGEQLVSVDPDKIEEAIKKIEAAKAEGKETVTINGTTVKITDDLIDAFTSTNNAILNISPPKEKGGPDFNPPKSAKEKIRLAAIVKDNIGDDCYEEVGRTKRNLNKELPSALKTNSLFDYQQIGIAWLQESFNQGKRGVILADDMGLGKSLQCLAFLAWLKDRIASGSLVRKPILIVGPTGLLQNWKDEHSKHLHHPGLGMGIDAFGDSFRKLRELSYREVVRKLSSSDWVLTTYDTLRDQERYFRAVDWLVIVFDESQAIKNPSSLKTDMAKAMAADFSIAVTGTPVENTLCDLWCIADTVFPGKLGLYKAFQERYEKTNENLKELKQLVVDELPSFMLRRLKVDNLKGLPAREFVVRNSEMPPDQARDYQKVIDDFKAGKYKNSKFQVIHDLKRTSLYDFKKLDADFEHHLKYSGRLQLLISVL
ncbi:MAG: DEAD/DEAH box helicase, partial [Bacteriovoracia bacterium]